MYSTPIASLGLKFYVVELLTVKLSTELSNLSSDSLQYYANYEVISVPFIMPAASTSKIKV